MALTDILQTSKEEAHSKLGEKPRTNHSKKVEQAVER